MKKNNVLTSTANAFMIMGCVEAAWAPLVPYVKEAFSLNEGQLGLLLLSSGAGAISALPIAGWATMRFGVKRMVYLSGVLLAATLFVISLQINVWLTAAMLFIFGSCTNFIDVSANLMGIQVEKEQQRPLMSGFHGGYALGTLIGTGAVTLLFTIGLSSEKAIGVVNMGLLTALWLGCKGLYNREQMRKSVENKDQASVAENKTSEETVSSESIPWYKIPPLVIVIGVLCFIVYASEGAMMSWSGVFAHDYRGVDMRYAGYFFLAYAVSMTILRLVGNKIVARFGDRRTVCTGTLLVAIGMVIAVVIPHYLSAILGFLIVGAGTANTVPRLISLGGTVKGIKVQYAISIINALGYSGVLLGPVIIGFVAQHWGLTTSFLGVAGFAVMVSLVSFKIFKK